MINFYRRQFLFLYRRHKKKNEAARVKVNTGMNSKLKLIPVFIWSPRDTLATDNSVKCLWLCDCVSVCIRVLAVIVHRCECVFMLHGARCGGVMCLHWLLWRQSLFSIHIQCLCVCNSLQRRRLNCFNYSTRQILYASFPLWNGKIGCSVGLTRE